MNTYKSPAKVNLNLKVLGRREDGFHEVETLMARIDLADTMHFEKADEFQIICDYPGVPLDEKNLVWQAVSALEERTDKKFNYRITIEKVIPHGAGLAGGSSNAATALSAINEIENLGLSLDELADIASEFGSDIAFFLYQSTCICKGRGEKIELVDIELGNEVLLVKPSFGVSTPQAYKAWKDSREIKGIDYSSSVQKWGEMVNHLERPVFEKHRFLAELKMWLNEQSEVARAMMSGSGSTVFALLKDGAEGLEKRVLEALDDTLFVCKARLL